MPWTKPRSRWTLMATRPTGKLRFSASSRRFDSSSSRCARLTPCSSTASRDIALCFSMRASRLLEKDIEEKLNLSVPGGW